MEHIDHSQKLPAMHAANSTSAATGKSLLEGEKETNHTDDVKKAATKERVQAFLADSGKISGVLSEGRQNKVTAFLQRHPKLTFVLGGAVLALSGLAFTGVVVGTGGLLALSVSLIVIPAVLMPITAPIGLSLGVCIGTGVLGAVAIMGTMFAPVAFSLAGMGLGMLGIDMVAGSLNRDKHIPFQKSLKEAGANEEEIEAATEHLKRAQFMGTNVRGTDETLPFTNTPGSASQRAELALRVKHDISLTPESKESLLIAMADRSPLSKVNELYSAALVKDSEIFKARDERAALVFVIENHQNLTSGSKEALLAMLIQGNDLEDVKKEMFAAREWDHPLEVGGNLHGNLEKLLPDKELKAIMNASANSYAERCDQVFQALKKSKYVKGAKGHAELEESPFKARRVEALMGAALEDKQIYYQQALVNAPYEQLAFIDQHFVGQPL